MISLKWLVFPPNIDLFLRPIPYDSSVDIHPIKERSCATHRSWYVYGSREYDPDPDKAGYHGQIEHIQSGTSIRVHSPGGDPALHSEMADRCFTR